LFLFVYIGFASSSSMSPYGYNDRNNCLKIKLLKSRFSSIKS